MLLGLVLALGSAGAQDGSCNATGIWPMPHQCEIAGAGTLEIKTDSLLVVATNLSDTNAAFAAHELCRRLTAGTKTRLDDALVNSISTKSPALICLRCSPCGSRRT